MQKMYGNRLIIVLLMLPALLLFLFFIPIPTLFLLIISLFKWDLITDPVFTGFGNYRYLFTGDFYFWNALKNNVIWLTGGMLLNLVPAFFLALILSRKIRGRTFFRSVIFMPSTLSSTAVSLIWYFVYHYKIGVLNQIIRIFGDKDFEYAWLLDARIALYCVMVTVAWQWTGHNMVIYLSGLAAIPDDILDAARIDGANGWKMLTKIIVPYMMPIIKVTLILSSVNSFKGFDAVFVMTGGGPNHASDLLALLMYKKSFSSGMYGYGSSIAVIITMLCICFTFIFNKVFERSSMEG